MHKPESRIFGAGLKHQLQRPIGLPQKQVGGPQSPKILGIYAISRVEPYRLLDAGYRRLWPARHHREQPQLIECACAITVERKGRLERDSPFLKSSLHAAENSDRQISGLAL